MSDDRRKNKATRMIIMAARFAERAASLDPDDEDIAKISQELKEKVAK